MTGSYIASMTKWLSSEVLIRVTGCGNPLRAVKFILIVIKVKRRYAKSCGQ